MEEKKFTWFPKFTRQLECVPEGHRLALAMAVVEYGTYGTEPDFSDWGLAAVFEGMRDDIDNSKEARYGNKGGRPAKTGVSDDKTGVSDGKTPVSAYSRAGNGGSDGRNPIPNQTSTDYTNPDHSSPSQAKKGEGRAPFRPPTREEAAEYLESLGLSADLDKVFDHYESNGWRCGRNPMRDWRAAFRRAARDWARKEAPDADLGEYADAI